MVVLGVLGLSRGGSALCEGREDQVRPGPGVQQHRGRAGVRQGEPCFVLRLLDTGRPLSMSNFEMALPEIFRAGRVDAIFQAKICFLPLQEYVLLFFYVIFLLV